MAKRDYGGVAIPFEFIPLPKRVLRSTAWRSLSYRGQALALALSSQYTGRNNGRLCPSFEVMKRDHGWTSKDQLIKAKRELLECPFAIRTRKGRAPRTAEWIGMTWWRLDYNATMEVDPASWPYLNFIDLKDARIDPNEGRMKLNGTANSVVRSTDRSTPKKPPTWSAARTDGAT